MSVKTTLLRWLSHGLHKCAFVMYSLHEAALCMLQGPNRFIQAQGSMPHSCSNLSPTCLSTSYRGRAGPRPPTHLCVQISLIPAESPHLDFSSTWAPSPGLLSENLERSSLHDRLLTNHTRRFLQQTVTMRMCIPHPRDVRCCTT